MFPNIKNKFRFVTVSLMLGSLVSVISSASAVLGPNEDLSFNLSVTACVNRVASMAPAFSTYNINAGETVNWPVDNSISARQGEDVRITTNLNWANGSNDCGSTFLVLPTGTFSATFVDLPGDYFPSSNTGLASDTNVISDFEIPTIATITNEPITPPLLVTYRLTWTP